MGATSSGSGGNASKGSSSQPGRSASNGGRRGSIERGAGAGKGNIGKGSK